MIEVPASQPAWKLLLPLLVGLAVLETHRLLEEDLHGPGSEEALQTSSSILFSHYFDIFNSLFLLSESGGNCFRNCPLFPSRAGRRGPHMIFTFWLFHFGRAAFLLASLLWLQLATFLSERSVGLKHEKVLDKNIRKFWIKTWESSLPGLRCFPLSLWLSIS